MNRDGGVPLPEPLAYFLTWPTYGTWLPGDERGWVDRGHGFQAPNPGRKWEAAARLTDDDCQLDVQQRHLVEETIAGHCLFRGWTLHAVNCRTNHVHVVVTASAHPDAVRTQFKAWCTRRLKELDVARGVHISREQWWAERGNKRYINDMASLEAAIQYVRDAQDSPR